MYSKYPCFESLKSILKFPFLIREEKDFAQSAGEMGLTVPHAQRNPARWGRAGVLLVATPGLCGEAVFEAFLRFGFHCIAIASADERGGIPTLLVISAWPGARATESKSPASPGFGRSFAPHLLAVLRSDPTTSFFAPPIWPSVFPASFIQEQFPSTRTRAGCGFGRK